MTVFRLLNDSGARHLEEQEGDLTKVQKVALAALPNYQILAL
jgi:hypothetical protein